MSSRFETLLDAIPIGSATWIGPSSSSQEDAEYFSAVEADLARSRPGYRIEKELTESQSGARRLVRLLVRRLPGE